MDRRYQVFVSSTFTDLVEERREIMSALLEMECLPAGMELFPATNEDQWSLIQSVIEESDYYVVVVGNRYGSLTETGISYTEKEFDYAEELGIPVLGFVHSNPESLPFDKSEPSDAVRAKLAAFREKVRSRPVRGYDSPAQLGSVMTRSLNRLMKKEPREGWVRGRFAMTADQATEVAQLRATLAELRLVRQEETQAADVADPLLEQGSDLVELFGSLIENGMYPDKEQIDFSFKMSWDDILRAVGPGMIDEVTELSFRSRLSDLVRRNGPAGASDLFAYSYRGFISNDSWALVKVQLRALGFVELGTKRRIASDTDTYWQLTDRGSAHLNRLLARRRPTAQDS